MREHTENPSRRPESGRSAVLVGVILTALIALTALVATTVSASADRAAAPVNTATALPSESVEPSEMPTDPPKPAAGAKVTVTSPILVTKAEVKDGKLNVTVGTVKDQTKDLVFTDLSVALDKDNKATAEGAGEFLFIPANAKVKFKIKVTFEPAAKFVVTVTQG